MHAHAPHRARVIAASSSHTATAADVPAEQLTRQAALFRRLFDGPLGGDAPAPGEDETTAAATPEAPAAETGPLEAIGAIAEHAQEERRDGEEDNDSDNPDRGDGSGSSAGNRNGVHDAYHARTPCAMPAVAALRAPVHADLPSVSLLVPMQALAARDTPAQARTQQRNDVRAVTAIDAPAHAGDAMYRLVESIVAEVAGFCANAVVRGNGSWEITIPLDPALLPGCTLSVALSRFQLTLRFETEQAQSRQLISRHAATLRASLEHVLQTHIDGSRSVEIIVT